MEVLGLPAAFIQGFEDLMLYLGRAVNVVSFLKLLRPFLCLHRLTATWPPPILLLSFWPNQVFNLTMVDCQEWEKQVIGPWWISSVVLLFCNEHCSVFQNCCLDQCTRRSGTKKRIATGVCVLVAIGKQVLNQLGYVHCPWRGREEI